MPVTFTNNGAQVKGEMQKASIAWLEEACGELEAQTKRNTKVITGKTKGSFQHSVDESALEGQVGSDYENAIWEEFGTGEYALEGGGRKGGWFYVDSKGDGHFTMGKKPKRAMFNAFTSLKGKLQKMAEERFKGM